MNLAKSILASLVFLVGCKKNGDQFGSNNPSHDSKPSEIVANGVIGEWESEYSSSDWGRMKHIVKFNEDGSFLLLIFPEERPSEPIGSLDGSWNIDGSYGTLTWNKSKLLSKGNTITKNLKDDPSDSFRIADDSVLHISIASKNMEFTKVIKK